jgi:hypothetical protein
MIEDAFCGRAAFAVRARSVETDVEETVGRPCRSRPAPGSGVGREDGRIVGAGSRRAPARWMGWAAANRAHGAGIVPEALLRYDERAVRRAPDPMRGRTWCRRSGVPRTRGSHRSRQPWRCASRRTVNQARQPRDTFRARLRTVRSSTSAPACLDARESGLSRRPSTGGIR